MTRDASEEADRLLLVELLLRTGALRFGEFRLKDGRVSPYFLDFGALHRGRDLAALGRLFARKLTRELPGGFDLVYGPPYKALPLAVATVLGLWEESGLDRPYLSHRKETKPHGEGGDFLGPACRGGERVVVLDDVFTSGGTKHEALEHVARWSQGRAEVVAVLVGVDRQERQASAGFQQATGIPVLTLVGMEALLDLLRHSADPRLDEATWRRIEVFRERG